MFYRDLDIIRPFLCMYVSAVPMIDGSLHRDRMSAKSPPKTYQATMVRDDLL